jgi:hypothetical protein
MPISMRRNAVSGGDEIRPPTELTLMMQPLVRFRISGMTA